MKTLAVCLLMGLLGAVFAMDRVAAQTAPATGTQLITLGTAGGPLPRADRAQSSNLLVVNGALYLIDMQRDVIEHPDYIPQPVKEKLNLRAGEDRGLSEAVSPAVPGGVVCPPHPCQARAEPAAAQSEASPARETMAAVREAPAGPSVANRREIPRADPRHSETVLSVHGHR